MSEEQENPPQANITGGPPPVPITVSQVHYNVTQEAIVVTEDKVRLCLDSHLHHMERRLAWVAPLGILLTLVITLLTTTFKGGLLGLDASTWHGMFVLGVIGSLLWLVYTVWQAIRSKSIDDIVETLKRGSPAGATSNPKTGLGPPSQWLRRS